MNIKNIRCLKNDKREDLLLLMRHSKRQMPLHLANSLFTLQDYSQISLSM